MAAITQPSQDGDSGRRYGAFTGKAIAGHAVGRITQLSPGGTPGRRYGTFSGKGSTVTGSGFYIFGGSIIR